MPTVEQLERLARYRADALEPAERAAVEAELASDATLRAGLARLEALDAAADALPTELDERHVTALVNGALGSRTRPVRAPWLVSAAALVALCAVLAWAASRAPADARHAVAVTGPVVVNGRTLVAGESVTGAGALASGDGSAVLLLDSASWLVPSNVELTLASPVRLERGAVVVRGVAELEAGRAHVAVDGLAVVAMEPSPGLSRVTGQLERVSAEDLMKREWMRLGGVGAAMAALGSAVTVVVMSGSASTTVPGEAPVVVQAGEAWRPGAAPTKLAALAANPAVTAGIDPLAEPLPTSSKAATAYAGYSREQLVALAESLRDEKERLLTERAQLKKALADAKEPGHAARNYYRFDPEELMASAKKGELRLRGPQLGERPAKLSAALRASTGLSDAEAQAVEDVFNGSTRRAKEQLVSLYREIGGDARSAETLSAQSLLSELRDKALPGQFEAAVRQLANERAGLVPPMDPAAQSAILRALRIYVNEDTRVLDELDRLLGPGRAEAFLNDGELPKSDNTFGVGPPEPGH